MSPRPTSLSPMETLRLRLLPDIPGTGSRTMLLYLAVLSLASTISFQGWNTLYTNFAVHAAHLTGSENGFIQSMREVPGLLTVGVIPLLLLFREHTLAALATLVTGLGVALAGFFPNYWGIMVTTLIMSFGFHYFEALNHSLTLQYFDLRTAPLVAGRMRGLTAGGNLFIGGVILLLSSHASFMVLFALAGCAGVVAGLWALRRDPSDPSLPVQHSRMIFRARYWLFYALIMLSGARRQVFVVFSVFLLVERFGYGVPEITTLFMVNNAVNWFLNPLIGRAINHFGERKLLSLEYLALVAVFIIYAHTDNHLIAGAMYIVDNIVFNFVMAVRTFFQKIADPADIAPSMAVSVTVNHVAAVVIPAIGGLLWMVDYRIPFYAGACMAIVSLLLVQCMDRELAKHGSSC